MCVPSFMVILPVLSKYLNPNHRLVVVQQGNVERIFIIWGQWVSTSMFTAIRPTMVPFYETKNVMRTQMWITRGLANPPSSGDHKCLTIFHDYLIIPVEVFQSWIKWWIHSLTGRLTDGNDPPLSHAFNVTKDGTSREAIKRVLLPPDINSKYR